MKQKIAVTLDGDLVTFLDAVAAGNRSDYINNLLRSQRQQVLEAEMIAALKSDAADPDYQAEIAAWDSVVGDGIDAER